MFLLRHGREHLQAFAERRWHASRSPRPGTKLVIILFPAHPLRIAGGLFVLLNLAKDTREILAPHGYEVLVVYPPRWPGLPTYPYYPGSERIYTFAQAMRLFPAPDMLYIHVPDCMAADVFKNPATPEGRWLRSARNLHINICNQNSELMPRPDQIAHLRALPAILSQSVAHEANDTQENADRWGMPLRYLGAYYGSEYKYRTHAEKENIIAYSPDLNPHMPEILATLRRRFSGFRFYRLSGIPYVTYLDAISRSKYIISFGEGWDGYFWEPFFCGSISCCVKNLNFFPADYNNFQRRIYNSYDDLQNKFPLLIEEFEDDPELYDAYAHECYACVQATPESIKEYFHECVSRLYQQEFDFYPLCSHSDENCT